LVVPSSGSSVTPPLSGAPTPTAPGGNQGSPPNGAAGTLPYTGASDLVGMAGAAIGALIGGLLLAYTARRRQYWG
jgi:LPXTG-motif cell wall-anchored protein